MGRCEGLPLPFNSHPRPLARQPPNKKEDADKPTFELAQSRMLKGLSVDSTEFDRTEQWMDLVIAIEASALRCGTHF